MKGKIGLLGACFGTLLACSSPNSHEQLATRIDRDSTLCIVDSMARAVIRSGLNAGSGYSQIWARDMNTFIETACEETDRQVLREAILLFFALQQPNDEMIDGYVLKKDFTWYDDTPYYSEAAPDHVAFKNTVETDQESSLILIVSKYIRKTGDRSILQAEVAGRRVLERMEAMVNYLMRERYDAEYGLLSDQEIRTVNAQMVENVRLSGMPSIGLTLYPTYPEGLFRGGMAHPYPHELG